MVQDCICCVNNAKKYGDLEWTLHTMCKNCADNYAEVLWCGGHYTTVFIFRGETVVSNYNFPTEINDVDELIEQENLEDIYNELVEQELEKNYGGITEMFE